MVKERKNERVYIRMDETLRDEIDRKSENFPSISEYIRTLVNEDNEDLRRPKLETMREILDFKKSLEGNIGHIGSNINQMARQLNTCVMEGTGIEPSMRIDFDSKLSQILEVLKQIAKTFDVKINKAFNGKRDNSSINIKKEEI